MVFRLNKDLHAKNLYSTLFHLNKVKKFKIAKL